MNANSCTCLYAPDPGCPVDHLFDDENRQAAITSAAEGNMVNPEWLSQACIDPLDSADMWRLFNDGDYIAFCERLRKELELRATAEAMDEVSSAERRAA
jgi:hypothetical protein